jgi:hypothetical protein
MRPASLALVLAGLIVACGAEVEKPFDPGPPDFQFDGGPAPGLTNPNSSEPSDEPSLCQSGETSCLPARHLATAADLVFEARDLAWQGVSISRTSVLFLSDDFVADADLEVDAAQLTVPPDCTEQTCHAPLFRDYAFPAWAGPGVPGVTCAEKGDQPTRKGDTCTRITIAKGTTFRLRRVVEDMHPSAPTYWPFVEFAQSCTTPCGDAQLRCPNTHTCFASGYESCAFCDGAPVETCACREGCGTKADGAACTFDSSPDVEVNGACHHGTCEGK